MSGVLVARKSGVNHWYLSQKFITSFDTWYQLRLEHDLEKSNAKKLE